MDQFEIAVAYYREFAQLILSTPQNTWALDPSSLDITFSMTPIESALWECLRSKAVVCYPQYPVGRFFADFANPVAKVALECDGLAFHTDRVRDQERDRPFKEAGWVVYRIPGHLCVAESEDAEKDSFPLRFVRAIGVRHGLIRGLTSTSPLSEDVEYCLQYSLEGRLGLLGRRPLG